MNILLWPFHIVAFVFLYAGEVLQANLQVAADVLTPGGLFRPKLIEVPVELDGPWQITLLANLVTFTPGTISVDFDEQRKLLTVHLMYEKDEKITREKIRGRYTNFIRRVLP